MASSVLVVCEQRDNILQKVSLELIGKGKELAEKVFALIAGSNVENLSGQLINHGADEVIYVEDEILKDYMTEPYTKAVAAVLKNINPEIVLIGASSIGRDLAPRVAARIKTGLTADCTSLEIDEETGDLLMTRPAFGGNIMATIVCPKHRPQMATVRPGVMVMRNEEHRAGAVRKFDVDFSKLDMNVEILETIKITKKTKDITEAKVLVSGGRGVGKKENFSLLQELADLFNGLISASRAAVDMGIANKEMQVGQTGKTVRPDIYFACGISGAVQHVAGMEESGLTIAINRNAEAPIFDVADVGIVGDYQGVLPKLIQRIKQERNLV